MSPDELKSIQDELEKKASDQEADKLEAEADASNSQAEADRQKADAARMKEGALAEAGDLLQKADAARMKEGALGEAGDLLKSAMGLTGKTAAGSDFDKGKLSNKIRRMINGKLNRVGLDGNGRFRTAQKGYVRALDVLQGFGIELGEVVSSSRFREDANEFNIHLSFKNMDDPFSPSDIKNTMLHISYTRLDDDRYEVLAYMT